MDMTLIETMPLGEIEEDRTDQYLPLSLVRANLLRGFSLEDIPYKTGGPARYVEVKETGGTARLHHADDAQFLRKLQPRPPDVHRHALHVPWPG
jgi:molybdenum cofactor biosynthesis enzyme MoaA